MRGVAHEALLVFEQVAEAGHHLVFATVGVYGIRQSTFDLVLLYAICLLGLMMRRFDFLAAPVVIGMILEPLAEAQMRNALSIGEGK